MSVPNGGRKLRDIAALVGCSVATISNAVNGTGRMSDAMREKILPKCAELFGNVFYARIMEGLAWTPRTPPSAEGFLYD